MNESEAHFPSLICIPFCFLVSYMSIDEGLTHLSPWATSSSSSHCWVFFLWCSLRPWYAFALGPNPTCNRFHRLRRDGTVEVKSVPSLNGENNVIYQFGPVSSSSNDSCVHPGPPVYGAGTYLGCLGRCCSMEPTGFQLSLRRPALLLGCNLVRTGVGMNLGGHVYGTGQFLSEVPESQQVLAPDWFQLAP